MKNNIRLIAVVFASIVFFACEQEFGTKYQGGDTIQKEISFASAKQVCEVEGGNEIAVKLQRSSTSGVLDAPIIFTTTDAMFTMEDPAVHFAAGEAVAYAKISFPDVSQLAIGHTYDITLTIDTVNTENILSSGGILVNTLSVSRKMTFLGKGTLNSTWFVEDDIPVQIFKANGAEIYKIVEPYGEGYDMLVSIDGNKATVAKQQVDLDSGVAPLYVEGNGTFENGVITLSLDFILYYPANTVYYQELGNVEVITLPEE